MKDYSDYSQIKARREGSVLVLSMNRPEKLNAMSGEMHAELARIFADVARDPDADVIVLTGEGRAFTAGGELSWIKDQTAAETDRSFAEARKIIVDILELPQPLVAAVNGHAIGLGATLAAFSDIAIAAAGCKIGDPHIVLGLVPGDGATVIWPMLVGMARAKRYLLTGDPITAEQAAEMGLIAEVLPQPEVLPAALRMAQRLAALPKIGVRGTKASLNQVLREAVAKMLDASLAMERRSKESSEHRTALNAYIERHERSMRT
jgi:enoyl-CoA hydratase